MPVVAVSSAWHTDVCGSTTSCTEQTGAHPRHAYTLFTMPIFAHMHVHMFYLTSHTYAKTCHHLPTLQPPHTTFHTAFPPTRQTTIRPLTLILLALTTPSPPPSPPPPNHTHNHIPHAHSSLTCPLPPHTCHPPYTCTCTFLALSRAHEPPTSPFHVHPLNTRMYTLCSLPSHTYWVTPLTMTPSFPPDIRVVCQAAYVPGLQLEDLRTG